MTREEFIERHKAEPKGYCPCVIDAMGEIQECPQGHLNALLELKEAKTTLAEIPNNVSPLFYMIIETRAVVVDYENQVYSGELIPQQRDSLTRLSDNGMIEMNLKNIHNKIYL